MLPILIVLFLVSYGLMSMLVVEQGSTIESQRFLIRQLLGDSTQLSAMKGKANQQQQQAQAQAKAQAEAQAQAQADAQAPSSQGSARDNAKGGHSIGKLHKPFPKPPVDTADLSDVRRMLLSI